MRQKLIRPLALILLLSSFLFIKKWSLQEDSNTSLAKKSTGSISKVISRQDQISDFKTQKPLKKVLEDQQQIKIAYEKAAYKLAEKIEKHQLDGAELNTLFSKLGRERFLRRLPEEVKAAYLDLEEKIEPFQTNLKKEDGIHEEFFNRYQTFIPPHLKKQREELDRVQLKSNVEHLVHTVVQKDQVTNEDVENILSACGMKNIDCINKSFAQVIEANHGLSEIQLKNIQEYL